MGISHDLHSFIILIFILLLLLLLLLLLGSFSLLLESF